MENKELKKLIIDDVDYTTRLSKKFASRKPYQPASPGSVISFIPGTIMEIVVKEGAHVNIGDDLIILEAMKMKNRLKSLVEGDVKSINVNPGQRVTRGMVLMEIA
jgi:biotin carboxyl carrier protein